jgi:alpha-D-ribose 1-methylphosphonate 5-phosphate C-P lyase
MLEYAALVASPRALPDGQILVFQHPAKTPLKVLKPLLSLFFI